MKKISDAPRRVKTNESTIVLVYFSAHIGNDAGVWKGVIGRHFYADFNDNRGHLLKLCCDNALCTMNSFFQHKDVHNTRGAEILWINSHSLISA